MLQITDHSTGEFKFCTQFETEGTSTSEVPVCLGVRHLAAAHCSRVGGSGRTEIDEIESE